MRASPVSAFWNALSVGVAAELGEALQLRLVGRQALRLLVGDHLQAMLDPAQESVGRR